MLSNYFSKAVYQLIKFIAASIALGCLLAACASQPVTPQQKIVKPITKKLMAYNKLAALAEPRRSITAINNASLAAQKQQYALSESYLLLAQLNDSNTAVHQAALVVAANLVQYSGQAEVLSHWFALNKAALATNPSLNNAVKRFHANTAMRNNDYPVAAQLGLALSNAYTLSSAEASQLWQALQALTLNNAEVLSSQQVLGSVAAGWAQLATAYLDNGSSLQQQSQQLKAWQTQWSNHPATAYATTDINTIAQRAEQLLDTAVIVIPLTGRLRRAGKAIQAAILAAHLERPQFKHLVFLNSADFDSAERLLVAINEHSPQVIIGPLDKNKARDLSFNFTRSTPMVSLNSYESASMANDSYQMSLNIEDEGEYLAQAAPAEHSRALLITTTKPLAIRATDAFKHAWLARPQASLISAELSSAEGFSKLIEASFLLTDSKSRQTKLENIFIEKMDSNPRRRKDIDLILLAATASEARAINPLLAYHYAGNLPVFSPSIIFDGQRRSVANSDLSGIIFTDTPWAIEQQSLAAQLKQHIRSGGIPSKNLHALGLDAYFLAARTGLWKTGLAQSFNGASGQLQITPSGAIKRIPRLALFTKRGVKAYQPAQIK